MMLKTIMMVDQNLLDSSQGTLIVVVQEGVG